MEQIDGKHPCPVCGRTIFREYDSYDICEFCGWEDNAYQEEHPCAGGGPNSSLYSYRKKYRQKIAADPEYTWAKECDEQREKKGIFWIADRKNLQNNEPYLFCIPVDSVGVPCFLTPIPPLNSKHGDNYNHKQTWETYVSAELRQGKTYDYYPRGRVEIKEKGKAKIFLNPDIATDEIVAYIIEKFRLQHRDVKVIVDGSKHYRYSAEEER
mgnify:CR=1 FL=1